MAQIISKFRSYEFDTDTLVYLPWIALLGIGGAIFATLAAGVVGVPVMSVVFSLLFGEEGWNNIANYLDDHSFGMVCLGIAYAAIILSFISTGFRRKQWPVI